MRITVYRCLRLRLEKIMPGFGTTLHPHQCGILAAACTPMWRASHRDDGQCSSDSHWNTFFPSIFVGGGCAGSGNYSALLCPCIWFHQPFYMPNSDLHLAFIIERLLQALRCGSTCLDLQFRCFSCIYSLLYLSFPKHLGTK